MWVLRFAICVALCVFPSTIWGTVLLLDQMGKDQVPKERKLDLSFIGILTVKQGGKPRHCNAIHLETGVTLSAPGCLKDLNSSEATLTFFDKSKKRKTEKVSVAEMKIKLPSSLESQWAIAGNPAIEKEEKWFGGFKPTWELVRVWGYVSLGEEKFQMQVNSCKSARSIPEIQRVKQDPEDGEDVLEEIPLFDKKLGLASFPLIEDCIKPLDDGTAGALITLAKDFNDKRGLVEMTSFSPFATRQLSSLTSAEEHIVLRYIGAGKTQRPLPADLTSFKAFFALPLMP